MAAITQVQCSACGQRHTLFLPAADSFDIGAEYEYTCPNRCRILHFTAGKESDRRLVATRPRGSVVANRIGEDVGEAHEGEGEDEAKAQ